MSRYRVGEPSKGITFLAAASFNHGQHAFHEATAARGLGTERELAPDHRVTQGLFRGIVGRLDPFDIDEGPKTMAIRVKLVAEAVRAPVEVAAQQIIFDPRGPVSCVGERLAATACHRERSATWRTSSWSAA